jgi:hypothetical protein
LEERSVVRFNESVCGDGDYVLEWTVGEDWHEVGWGDKRPAPGDCVAYALLEPPSFRACCVWEDRRDCLPAALRVGPIECTRIFVWESGREYDAESIEQWNANHAAD